MNKINKNKKLTVKKKNNTKKRTGSNKLNHPSNNNQSSTIKNNPSNSKKKDTSKKKDSTKKQNNIKQNKTNQDLTKKNVKQVNKNKQSIKDNLKNIINRIANKLKDKSVSRKKVKKTSISTDNKLVKESKRKKDTKKDNELVKLDYKSLTTEQIEKELKRETYRLKYFNILSSTVYSLIIIAAIALIVATFIMPVLEISGNSMSPKFDNGDYVVSIKTNNLDTGDIIAFYHGNKILVKRVIAKPGQWVVIDEDGTVYIDGVKLNEPYIEELSLGDCDIKFPYQVPDGSWFVLSDNRTNSIDSRNSDIGSINKDDVIGKILFRIWDANK